MSSVPSSPVYVQQPMMVPPQQQYMMQPMMVPQQQYTMQPSMTTNGTTLTASVPTTVQTSGSTTTTTTEIKTDEVKKAENAKKSPIKWYHWLLVIIALGVGIGALIYIMTPESKSVVEALTVRSDALSNNVTTEANKLIVPTVVSVDNSTNDGTNDAIYILSGTAVTTFGITNTGVVGRQFFVNNLTSAAVTINALGGGTFVGISSPSTFSLPPNNEVQFVVLNANTMMVLY